MSQHHAGPASIGPVAAYPVRRHRAVMPRSRAGCTASAAASRSYGQAYCSAHSSSPYTSRRPSRTTPASDRRGAPAVIVSCEGAVAMSRSAVPLTGRCPACP
ncbi:MAG: hypothetical protein ACRDPY_40550 [Streptosporangiaceae bacterium]